MSNYVYDENHPAGHGFSFSSKPGLDQISPRLQNFRPISERSQESSLHYKSPLTSSTQKARDFNIAPELTLDDLREKLRNDVDFQGKRGNKFEDSGSLKSSLYKMERPSHTPDSNIDLLSSTSPNYLDRSGRDKYKGINTDRNFGERETSRPFSALYKNTGDPSPWEKRVSLSPHSHQNRLSSSRLKSPTAKSAYSHTDTFQKYGKYSDFNPAHSGRDEMRSQISRSRSPTPTKGASGLADPKASSQYGASPYLASSTYSTKDLQQDLKEKIEQFNRKLAEVQEEFSQSKASQDPYKISLYSMKTLPKDEIDGISSKQESQNRPYKNSRDENFKNTMSNKDEKDAPLQMDNLVGSQNSKTSASASNLRKGDYTQAFKEIKLRYSDMFMPRDMKTLTNPFKILKQRYEQKFDKTVKGYLEETAMINNELDQNLFNAKLTQ